MTSTLKETTSVCAHCLERVAAVVVERDGQVFLRKSCPVHGDEEALLASDARLLAAHAQREPALVGVLTPNAPHRRQRRRRARERATLPEAVVGPDALSHNWIRWMGFE